MCLAAFDLHLTGTGSALLGLFVPIFPGLQHK